MLPDKIYFVIQGTVSLLSTIDEKKQHPGYQTVKTDPGSRVQTQVLNGSLGQHIGDLVGSFEKFVAIGLECPILQIQSAFTYVSKTHLTVLSIPLEAFMRHLDQYTPR
jgi:hypothetical protein